MDFDVAMEMQKEVSNKTAERKALDSFLAAAMESGTLSGSRIRKALQDVLDEANLRLAKTSIEETMSYDNEITGVDLETINNFTVTLASVGNPDHGQSPEHSLPGVKSITLPVKTLQQASDACQKYITENDLGSGNWSGGDVSCDGKLIARVSYNGRVWRPA